MLARNSFTISIIFFVFFSASIQKGYCGEAVEATQASHGNMLNSGSLPDNNPQPIPHANRKIKTRAKRGSLNSAVHHTPVTDKSGNIYISSVNGKISAIDIHGNTKWYLQLADKISFGPELCPGNTLYFCSEKVIYSISSNGLLKWIFRTDSSIGFPMVSDEQGNLYAVTAEDDFLYVIAPDGKLRWKSHINGNISSSPVVSPDGIVYVITRNNILYALNQDGSLRWRKKVLSRREEQYYSATQTNAVGKSSPSSFPEAKQIGTLEEPSDSQILHISHTKQEEIQYSAEESSDKHTITSFTASTQEGSIPLIVKFSDISTGRIVGREWDFGDGTSVSAEQSPVHVYAKPGNYNVRLTIKRLDCTSTVVKQSYIKVLSSDDETFVSSATDQTP
jgi:hypothetical protein